MAHTHDHHHDEELNSYLIEQIFTIGLCGALAAVTISLYAQNKLSYILHPKFHIWVLVGGLVLLGLVIIRAVSLWNFAGELKPSHEHDHDHANHDHDHACCDHDHDHAHEHKHSEAIAAAPKSASLAVITSPAATGHDHDHGQCCQHEHAHQAPAPVQPAANPQPHSHGHGHDDHDHGGAFWRHVLLLLPVALFFLNLPNEVFSSSNQRKVDMGEFDVKGDVADKNEVDSKFSFVDVERAALTPDSRTTYEGKTVSLVGRYAGIDDKSFTLTRYKISCCAADAIALNAIIMVDESHVKDHKQVRLDPQKLRNKWVRVTGKVRFIQRRNTNEYLTALVVTPTTDKQLSQLVEVVPPDPNPYAS